MTADKEYKRNRTRAFEIYGVKPNDPNYNCHHIIFRSDVHKYPELWVGFNVNQVSNLCPLKIRDHARVHEMVNIMEPQNRQ